MLAKDVVLAFPNFKKQFQVTTDASGIGLGAVLSQIQDNGEERPIAFASRVLSKAEKRYSTTERELLAIVYALEIFRPYLFGQKFLLITDHEPLTYIKTVKHPSDRLVRWICKLSEFDFDVRYKPGSELARVDAFSRSPVNIAAIDSTDDNTDVTRQIVELVGPLTIDEISDAQWSDEILRKFFADGEGVGFEGVEHSEMRTLIRRSTDIYKIDNVLYIIDNNKEKIILLPSLHETVFRDMHAQPFSGHLGVTKTLSKIRERYFWPGLSRLVADYVRQCRDCAMYKPANVNMTPPLIPITSTKALQLIELDIVGPFPVSDKGNKYIFTIIDTYTRWPEAYAIANQETETILTCLEDFISRHGLPDAILTDQGRNFESQLFKSFLQSFGIIKKRTTSYHPACNGQIERFNGTLVKIIARYVATNQKDWDTWIPAALHAYRTTEHATTKMTPFKLLYARDNKLPTDLNAANEEQVDQNTSTYVRNARRRLRDAYAKVNIEQRMEQARHKANYDRKAGNITFEEGDRVWLSAKAKKLHLNPKLQPKWLGPYTVKHKQGTVDYVIESGKNRKQITVHQSRLKPCYTPQEPIAKPARNVRKPVKTNVQNAQINDSSNESDHNSDDDSEDSDDERIMQFFTQRQLNANADAAQQAVTTAQTLPTVCPDPRADLPRAVITGRPQRERRPPQRYTPVSCIRIITNRAKKNDKLQSNTDTCSLSCKTNIYAIKTLVVLIMLSFGLLHVSYVTEGAILSDDIGEAVICATGIDGSLFSLGNEPDCLMPDPIKQKLITHITVRPFFRRSFSPIFKVWSCQVQHETVNTYTGFFGS